MRNGTGSQNFLWLIILGTTIALATVAQSKSDSAGDPFSQPHVVEARALTAREMKRAEAVQLSERLTSATSVTGHDVLELRTLGLSLEWFHADQPAEKSANAFAAYEKARQLVHTKLARTKGLSAFN